MCFAVFIEKIDKLHKEKAKNHIFKKRQQTTKNGY